MSTPTEDVVVRIYEVGCVNNGRITEFTVSLSMPISKARTVDRDSDGAHEEAWKRVEKIMTRDGIEGTATGLTFIRERLIPAARAKVVG